MHTGTITVAPTDGEPPISRVSAAAKLVVKPRGVPHAFWNAGDEEVRLLELISPGGFDRYFSEVVTLLAGGGPPDFEALAACRPATS